MNINQNLKHITRNSEQSLALARQLAAKLQAPFTLELIGDLGGGKTTFVKGLAEGLGVTQTVTSPTFTIHRSYLTPNNNSLEHFDLYRLAEAESEDVVVADELSEAVVRPGAFTAIEWAKPLEAKLPTDRLVVTFHYLDENSREIIFRATGPAAAKVLESLK